MLFWGRRVYWGAVLVVVTALRQGRGRGCTVERLRTQFGVTRPTLTRWLRYFREAFPQTRAWRWVTGRLVPPVAAEALPGGVVEQFVRARGDPEEGVVACLRALCLGGC